jgi:hypothetical protein
MFIHRESVTLVVGNRGLLAPCAAVRIIFVVALRRGCRGQHHPPGHSTWTSVAQYNTVQLYLVGTLGGSSLGSSDRLQMEEIREIAEICKTRIQQLLRSPYDSSRKSC